MATLTRLYNQLATNLSYITLPTKNLLCLTLESIMATATKNSFRATQKEISAAAKEELASAKKQSTATASMANGEAANAGNQSATSAVKGNNKTITSRYSAQHPPYHQGNRRSYGHLEEKCEEARQKSIEAQSANEKSRELDKASPRLHPKVRNSYNNNGSGTSTIQEPSVAQGLSLEPTVKMMDTVKSKLVVDDVKTKDNASTAYKEVKAETKVGTKATMTLQEYQRILEEKRKPLLPSKATTEERKTTTQQLPLKKVTEDISSIKQGTSKKSNGKQKSFLWCNNEKGQMILRPTTFCMCCICIQTSSPSNTQLTSNGDSFVLKGNLPRAKESSVKM